MANTTTIAPPEITIDKQNDQSRGPTGPRIRCPKCQWQPGPMDLWACQCGYTWHTFDTGGVCPSCLRQWMTTQCLKCAGWSAHSDWYEY